MLTQFLLFVIAILLISIFWVLSMIHSVLKKGLVTVTKTELAAKATGD